MRKTHEQDILDIRARIEKIEREMHRDLREMLGIDEMVKGSLCLSKRVCGKPNCRCARGELHVTWNLSFPGPEGKLTNVSMNPERLNRYQGPAEDYRRYRTARARLARRQRDVLGLLNELERMLLIDPPEGRGRKG